MKSFVFILSIVFLGWNRDDTEEKLPSIPLQESKKYYHVYQIDSINNLYIIYARKNNIIYKIVSRKFSVNGCKNLKIGNNYIFSLESLVHSSSNEPYDLSFMHLGGILIDNITITMDHDSINDLFRAKNLKGLCLEAK